MDMAKERAAPTFPQPGARVRATPAWLGEALPLALALGLALIVRWPYLLDWPAFTDETREVLLGLAVARGEQWPWVNVRAYLGPWHTYLLAGAFVVLGPTVWVPRGLVMALNVVAIGLTYRLARRVAGRTTGLLAAGLAAVSPQWVLVGSHVAWSASTTPAYVLGTLLAAHLALGPGAIATWTGGERRRGGWLLLAGVLLGLAGQTHPFGLLVAPALALAVAWGRAGRRRLRTPWPWLATAAAVAAYAPVLIYSTVIRPSAALAEVATIGGRRGLMAGVDGLLLRAPRMWWTEAGMVAGVAESGLLPAWSEPLADAATVVTLGLAAWGLVAVWRRGERLLPLAVAAVALLLPAATGYSGELYAERYAAPLVALIGILASAGVAPLARHRWLASGLGLLLVGLPLASLAAYYRQQPVSLNREAIATAAALAPAAGCLHVVIDQRLAGDGIRSPGGGTPTRALRMTLALAGIDYETRRVNGETLRAIAHARQPATTAALLTARTAKQPSLKSAPLTKLWRTSGHDPEYGVYLWGATALPACQQPAPAGPERRIRPDEDDPISPSPAADEGE